MRSFIGLIYAIVVYVFFLATFLYMIGFLGGLAPLKTIDSGQTGAVGWAVFIDLVLLGIFAVQHSLMARKWFKRWWTKIVPWPIERSTYVLAATAAVALLIWQWRPLTEPIWTVENPAVWWLLTGAFCLGWAMLLVSTFLINHFELFGLEQAYCAWRGKEIPKLEMRTPALYRLVRHPIYLSFLIAFWATPRMTAGHLLFSAGATGYILIGVLFEERDLVAQFGDAYRRYQQRVPMVVPGLAFARRRAAARAESVAERLSGSGGR